MDNSPVIIFPHLGIKIQNLVSGFDIGSFHIAFYGICIAVGMVLAILMAMHRAKKTGQYADDYVDIGIISVIAAIIGARIYYVIFSLDDYDSIGQMFNIRQGGLAFYGGLIGGILATFFVCRFKKISFIRVLDTAAPGIALAQAIGRWGNFFNMEAYGGYTDSLFAMQIKYSEAGGVVSKELIKNMVTVDGTNYIQVHPTYLYESAWCLLVFVLIMLLSKHQQYNGEVLLWYIGGYALERSVVEGLRTDQLVFKGSGIAVSQILSIGIVAAAFAILLINRIRIATGNWKPEFTLVLEDGAPGTKKYFDERKAKSKSKKHDKWEEYIIESQKENELNKQETENAEEEEAKVTERFPGIRSADGCEDDIEGDQIQQEADKVCGEDIHADEPSDKGGEA